MRHTLTILATLLVGSLSFGASVTREARLFTVDALVTPPVEWVQPMPEKGPIVATSPDTDEDYGPGGPFSTYGDEPRPVSPAFEGDELVELIRTFIAEDSWANERNELELGAGKLLVVQTPPVLAEVERFLEVLLARSMARYEIAVALVPPDAFAQARGEDARELPPEVFDKARLAGDAASSFFRTVVAEGETGKLAPVALRTAIIDIEVNQTGVAPVTNPLVGAFRDGLAFEGSVRTTPLDGVVELEYAVGIDETGKDRGLRRTPLGDIELPRTGGAVLSGASPVAVERTIVLGELKAAGSISRSFTALARVRRIPAAAAPPSPVGIVEVGALLRPGPEKSQEGKSEGASVSASSKAAPAARFSTSELLDKIRAAMPAALGDEDRLRLQIAGTALFVKAIGRAEDTDRATSLARETVRRLYEEKARRVDVLVWHGSIEESKLAPALERESGAVLLAKDWRARLALERETSIRLSGFAGRDMRLWAGDGRRYVADTEQVSGGTKLDILEVTDPIVRWAGSGLELRASASPVPGTPWIQVRLEGAVAATEIKRSLAIRADRSMSVERDGTVRPIGAVIDIELPDQKADRWNHFVAIPAGRAALLNSLPDPAEPGKVRVLIVETRL